MMLNNDTLRTIKNRRSTRSFKSEQIKDEELQTVLEAGMYAPSANDQAWHFTVIQNKDLLDRLSRDSKDLAKSLPWLEQLANDPKWHIFYGAPTAVLVSGKEDGIAIESDCAAATQNMLLAAESIGISSCWIGIVGIVFGGPIADAYRKELGIPDGYKLYASAALGYRSAEPKPAAARKSNLVNYVK